MQPGNQCWVGGLVYLLACAPSPSGDRVAETETTRPVEPAGPSAPVSPGPPVSPLAPNGASGPAVTGFDEAEISPVEGDVLGVGDACLTQTQQVERLGLD